MAVQMKMAVAAHKTFFIWSHHHQTPSRFQSRIFHKEVPQVQAHQPTSIHTTYEYTKCMCKSSRYHISRNIATSIQGRVLCSRYAIISAAALNCDAYSAYESVLSRGNIILIRILDIYQVTQHNSAGQH